MTQSAWPITWAFMIAVANFAVSAAQPPTLRLRLIAEGFVSPSVAVTLSAKQGTMLVADQTGPIRVMEKDGALKDDPFLDLTPKLAKINQGFEERGVLGLALHPKFQSNRRIFVFYSAPKKPSMPQDWDHVSRISEFKLRKDNPFRADLESERVILEIEKAYFNHNGGAMVFGPDGNLYVALGDGGNANGVGKGHSPISNGQDLSNLLGKIIRINVDRGEPYSIPRDNPFAKGGGKPEIYAYGFRNPWRMTFDRGGSRRLITGDIGQTLWEEVNVVQRGGNYGWFIKEGDICFDPANPKTPAKTCADKGPDGSTLLAPALVYKNPNGFRNDPEAIGISVIGGYVYRGKSVSSLQGTYVFGDWSRGWAVPEGVFMVATPSEQGRWPWRVADPVLEDGSKWKAYITGFAEDDEGELYVLTNGSNGLVGKTGKVYKVVGFDASDLKVGSY